jgi:hypothetical protein
LTGIVKVASPVSVERGHKAKPAKKAPKNTAQAERARKRWAGVPPEERSANARGMALERWATTEQGYVEAEHYFTTTDLDQAAETLQQMRKIYEMACKTLDTRFQAERQDQEKCSNPDCPRQAKFDRNNPWYVRYAVKDQLTSRLYNVFACSPQCAVAINAPGTKPREAPISDARNPNFQARA